MPGGVRAPSRRVKAFWGRSMKSGGVDRVAGQDVSVLALGGWAMEEAGFPSWVID